MSESANGRETKIKDSLTMLSTKSFLSILMPKLNTSTALHWSLVVMFVFMLCSGLLPGSQQVKQKFCGKSLTDAMDLVCIHGYNDKFSTSGHAKKRQANDFSVQSEMDVVADETSVEPALVLLNTYALSPFITGIYANILASKRHRRDNGVYDECCKKPCSYAELSSYCRP